jgi:hypothetical protein
MIKKLQSIRDKLRTNSRIFYNVETPKHLESNRSYHEQTSFNNKEFSSHLENK